MGLFSRAQKDGYYAIGMTPPDNPEPTNHIVGSHKNYEPSKRLVFTPACHDKLDPENTSRL